MSGRLDDRTALITGGSRGIGLGIAEGFAREGADVMLVASSQERLRAAAGTVEKHGRRVVTFACDIADRAACFEAVRETLDAFGKLDVLVNSAATYTPRPFVDYAPEEFDRILQVNLYGVFHLTQAVIPHMAERGYGKIINIASTAGKWASKNQSAYNVAKHGVVGMTRCVALETAPAGITVNAICPGLVETDLVKQFAEQHAELGGTTAEVVREELMRRVPVGRFLDVDECAHLAIYLASSESDGMTGQSILLDGGMLFV